MEVRQLTILFTNAKDSQRTLLQAAVNDHAGRVVTTIGSACVCIFENSNNAVKVAETYRTLCSGTACRIALTRGEVSITGSTLFGEPVNVAAQLEGHTESGGIWMTETVRDHLDPMSVPTYEVGNRSFKGVDRPVKIFAQGTAPTGPAKTPQAYFDYSRVEQERVQEENALRVFVPSAEDQDASIPLHEEEPTKPKGRVDSPLEWKSAKNTYPAQGIKPQIRNAILIFAIFVVLIPGTLLTAWWYVNSKAQKEEQVSQERIKEKVENSTVLKSLKIPRPKGISPKDIARGNIPTFASLVIETTPSRAEVYINDQHIGALTPVKIQKISANTPIHLVIKKPGFEDAIQLISLVPSENKIIEVRLRKK